MSYEVPVFLVKQNLYQLHRQVTHEKMLTHSSVTDIWC